MALLLGWDPLVFLRAEGIEKEVAAAVLSRAHQLRGEELARVAEVIGHHVANTVGRMFSG